MIREETNMNTTEEVNKLIVEYFRKHENIINSYDTRHEMIHDKDAQLDAIELVCDITNVYNSAIYHCAFEALKTPIEKIDTARKNPASQNMDKFADVVFWDLYHMRG